MTELPVGYILSLLESKQLMKKPDVNQNCSLYREYDTCEYNGHYSGLYSYYINRNEITSNQLEEVKNVFNSTSNCPYCATHLARYVFESIDYSDDSVLNICTNCGYWQVGAHDVYTDGWYWRSRWVASVQAKFNIKAPVAPMDELIQFLRCRPNATRFLDPRVFEELITHCFRANWQSVQVIHVGKVADGGVDIILVEADEKRWLVQCKRRKNEAAVESVKTVREMLGTLVSENQTRGIVVSNADHFSHYATRLAAKEHIKALGYTIRLLDRGVITQMIGSPQICPTIEQLTDAEWICNSMDAPWRPILEFYGTKGTKPILFL